MAFGKLIANDYQCDDCGATAYSRATDCCDRCILKFYLDDENAPDLADYGRPDNTIDPCEICGKSTAFGSGKFVNRLGWDDGWACAECAGYECDACEKQIYLDADITDKEEIGHYHPECLPLDQHYIDPDDQKCWCPLHEKENN